MTDETTLPGDSVSNVPLSPGSIPAGMVTGKPSEDTVALITPSSAKSWSAMGPKLLLGIQHVVRCISVRAKALDIHDDCERFAMVADGLCTRS